ncbi:MAG: tetratricopeptide repeat protein, partial [Chitinophagaceae bacterium]
AKDLINAATLDSKTADKAKTWYLKGQIYDALAKKDSASPAGLLYLDTAYNAYTKCLQIEPKYTEMLLTSYRPISNMYVIYWQAAADAFNNKDYKGALEDFKNVKKINDYLFGLGMGMGSKLDTMAILNIGNSAFNMGEKDTATYYYQQLADIKYTGQSFIYKVLLSQYRDKNNTKYLAVLDEAKALFPSDKDFADEEISYYNEKHDMGKLVEKLKEEVAKDPSDYNAILNLAITYDNMANPKNDSGQLSNPPANHDQLFSEAVDMYKKAISLKQDGYAANFNLGLMYYNAAAQIGKQLGQLGSSAADQAKQNVLAKQQDSILDQATPYLEKAYQVLDVKSSLDPNEMVAYKNAIIGLEGVYARQNNMDKYNELKKKLAAADSKAN